MKFILVSFYLVNGSRRQPFSRRRDVPDSAYEALCTGSTMNHPKRLMVLWYVEILVRLRTALHCTALLNMEHIGSVRVSQCPKYGTGNAMPKEGEKSFSANVTCAKSRRAREIPKNAGHRKEMKICKKRSKGCF